MVFNYDKYLLGDRYTIQVRPVTIQGRGGQFSTNVLTIQREPPVPNPENKKPYSFGYPMRLLEPLKKAIDDISSQSKLPKTVPPVAVE